MSRSRWVSLLVVVGLLAAFSLFRLPSQVAKVVWEPDPPRPFPVKSVGSAYYPWGPDRYVLRQAWKNVSDRPIRAVYVTIDVYNRNNERVCGAVDYPIY